MPRRLDDPVNRAPRVQQPVDDLTSVGNGFWIGVASHHTMPDADVEASAGMALLHAVNDSATGSAASDQTSTIAVPTATRRFSDERFGDGRVARRIARDPDRAVPENFKTLTRVASDRFS